MDEPLKQQVMDEAAHALGANFGVLQDTLEQAFEAYLLKFVPVWFRPVVQQMIATLKPVIIKAVIDFLGKVNGGEPSDPLGLPK